MKTLLCAKILARDDNFIPRLGFIRFDFGDSRALTLIADRVSFDFSGIEPLDRFCTVESESCAVNHGAWLLRVRDGDG